MNNSFDGPTSNGEEDGITGDEGAPGGKVLRDMTAVPDISAVGGMHSPFGAFMAATVAAGVENQPEAVRAAKEDRGPAATNDICTTLDSSGVSSKFAVTTDDDPQHPDTKSDPKGKKKIVQPIVDETLVGREAPDPESAMPSAQSGVHEVSSSSSANTEVGTEAPNKEFSVEIGNSSIGTSEVVGDKAPLVTTSEPQQYTEPTKLTIPREGILDGLSRAHDETSTDKADGESDTCADRAHDPLHSSLAKDGGNESRPLRSAERAIATESLEKHHGLENSLALYPSLKEGHDGVSSPFSFSEELFGDTTSVTKGDRLGDSRMDSALTRLGECLMDPTAVVTSSARNQNDLRSSIGGERSRAFDSLVNGFLAKPPIGSEASQRSQLLNAAMNEGKKRGALTAGLEARNSQEKSMSDNWVKKPRQAADASDSTFSLDHQQTNMVTTLGDIRVPSTRPHGGKEKASQFRLSSGSRKRKEPQNVFGEAVPQQLSNRDESADQPSVESLKMMLFLEGSKVHRGHGAERRFSFYWDCVSRFLSNKTPPRVSHRNSTQSMEAKVRSFLKTSGMKKLHNALVLALLKKCSKTTVARDVITRHVPERWKRRIIEITDRPSEIVETKRKKQPHKNAALMAFLTGWKKELHLHTVRGFEPPTDICQVRELDGSKTAAPTQGLESSGSSGTTDQSATLPGALEIDPFVRQHAKTDGMTVSEPAIWVLIIAMREYAKSVLEQAVSNAEGESKGRIYAPREMNPISVITERSSALDQGASHKKCPSVISPFHLSYVASSSKLLGGSLTSSSRLWSQSAITSCFSSPSSGEDARARDLRSHILEGMEMSTVKRRKVQLANTGLLLEPTEFSKPTVDIRKTTEITSSDNAPEKVSGSTKTPRQDPSNAPLPKTAGVRLGSKNLYFMLSRSDAKSGDEDHKVPSPAVAENGQDSQCLDGEHKPDNGRNDKKPTSERDQGEQSQGRGRGMKSLLTLKKSTSTREDAANVLEAESGHVQDADNTEKSVSTGKLADSRKTTEPEASRDALSDRQRLGADSGGANEKVLDIPAEAPVRQPSGSKEQRSRSGIGGKVLSVLVEKAGRTG